MVNASVAQFAQYSDLVGQNQASVRDEDTLRDAVKDVLAKLMTNGLQWVVPVVITTSTTSVNRSTATTGVLTLTPDDLIEQPSDDLAVVKERLWKLLEKEDEDDVTPSLDTMLKALWFVEEAASYNRRRFPQMPFPQASASTDDQGSIYLYWTKPDRRLQLTVPEDKTREPFIYHRKGDERRFVRPASPRRLAYWLDWFANK